MIYVSKQDEFIKQLYYGDDLFYENTRKDSSKKCELNKIRDEIHKKIMKALIQVYGEEEANKINEEWIGCSSEIEIEKGEGIKSDIAFEELRHKFGY